MIFAYFRIMFSSEKMNRDLSCDPRRPGRPKWRVFFAKLRRELALLPRWTAPLPPPLPPTPGTLSTSVLMERDRGPACACMTSQDPKARYLQAASSWHAPATAAQGRIRIGEAARALNTEEATYRARECVHMARSRRRQEMGRERGGKPSHSQSHGRRGEETASETKRKRSSELARSQKSRVQASWRVRNNGLGRERNPCHCC